MSTNRLKQHITGIFFLIVLLTLLTMPVFAKTVDVGPGYTYSTISAGVAAASSGDNVHVHAGTYTISDPIIMKSGVTLYGDGYSNTVIKAASKSDFASESKAAMIMLTGVSNVNIYGLKFQGPASSTSDIHNSGQTYYGGHDEYHSAIKVIRSSNVNIHDCYATLLLSDFVRMSGGTSNSVDIYNNIVDTSGHDGVQCWGGNDVHIYNNYFNIFINCGVRLAGTSSCLVEYNTFTSESSSGWCGVEIENSHSGDVVQYNVFTDMSDNYGIATVSSTASGCTIRNNVGYAISAGLLSGCSGATQSGNSVYSTEQNWASMGYGYNAADVVPGTAPPSTVYDGSALPTLTSPSAGATVTPKSGRVTFAWENVNSTEYQLQVATDTGFSSVVADTTTADTSISASLNNSTTYYWHVRAYNDAGSTWTAYTSYRSLTTGISEKVGSGIYGQITDPKTGAPVSGAVVTCQNDTWSSTIAADENGYYQFDVVDDGTYYVSASATDYQNSGTTPVTASEGYEENNVGLTQAIQYFSPHYVTFSVVSPWGTKYSDVVISIYEGNSTSGTLKTTGLTDDNGQYTFDLDEDKTYTITFVSAEQNINTQRTIMPADSLYRIRVWNAQKTEPTADTNSEIEPVSVGDVLYYKCDDAVAYNTTHWYINQTLTAADAGITSWSAQIYSVYANSTANGNFTYTETGIGNATVSQLVPVNASYMVLMTVVHPSLNETVEYKKIVLVKGYNINPYFDFGWENQWNYQAMGYVLLLLTGGLFGQRNKTTGVICVLGVGLFLRYIGWFQYDLTGEIMVYVAVLLAFAYILGKRY